MIGQKQFRCHMDRISGQTRKLVTCITLAVGCTFMPVSAELMPFSHGIENQEEAFLVRRIAEYWKDQDYQVVKAQIHDFLKQYPKSKINDHLRGILGDLYLQECEYEQALDMYQTIRDHDIFPKIALNQLQCLYELGNYNEMIAVGSPFLNQRIEEIELRSDEFHFLMAEAFFRSATGLPEGKQKTQYLAEAKPLYEKVMGSSFNDPTMFALAEIYRLSEENPKAATLFLELAERHQDQCEELLFHAALAQAEFDRTQAIETFSKIATKEGVKARDAALNKLILLFQEDRFAEVVEVYEPLLEDVSQEKRATLDYMIGRSYFALNNYENAQKWLGKFLAVADKTQPEMRNALLMQLNCAQQLKDEGVYEATMAQLEKLFPQDGELPQATFIHAMMLKEKGDFAAAEERLADLLNHHPEFEDQETLFLEYSLVTYNNENWPKSREMLKNFLDHYPESSHVAIAWKYYLSTSLNLMKILESGEQINYSKGDFLNDLNLVMGQENVLNQNEQKECRFLQGKIAYEIEDFDRAIAHLNDYISLYPQDESTPEAHLLVALCHHKSNGNPNLFCQHAEAALEGDSKLNEKSSIHLELFNVYLSMIKEGKEEHQPLYDLAAKHLYTALQLQELPVKLENQLWLANYYYDHAMQAPQVFAADGFVPDADHKEAYDKAFSLFEKILLREDSDNLIELTSNQTYLEWEVLKLANLVGRESAPERKVALLKSLIEQQTQHADWDWKLQKEALVELAKAYNETDRLENALETFNFIAENYRNRPTFVSEYAALHGGRLRFELMNPAMKVEDNAEVFKILNDMKELQIRKNVDSEPLHLEAALEYAWIRAQITPDEDRPMRYLFFLNRIKEDFENLEDPMVVDYHKNLKDSGEKAQIFAAYMEFLDAEIARCEAILANRDGRSQEGLEWMNKAKHHLSNLAESSSSFYLKIRSKESLASIKKSKIC